MRGKGHAPDLARAPARGPDRDAWQAAVHDVEADFVLVGHTHLPLHLRFQRTQVLNPGSVGQPKDGDPRAAYAVIEDGEARTRPLAVRQRR